MLSWGTSGDMSWEVGQRLEGSGNSEEGRVAARTE